MLGLKISIIRKEDRFEKQKVHFFVSKVPLCFTWQTLTKNFFSFELVGRSKKVVRATQTVTSAVATTITEDSCKKTI